MPVYVFRCEDTDQLFEIRKSIRDYDPNAVRSPFTGSDRVQRVIQSVVLQSNSGASQPSLNLDAMGDENPRQLADTMRRLADESNQPTSGEFNEVVRSLEKGKRPSELKEAKIPKSPPAKDA
ncbi:MAG: zinc ribbon domain-containing protein [Chloroflexota bacterium]